MKENPRYVNLEVRPGEYVPETGIDYPADDNMARLVPAPVVKQLSFDESYPYLDDSFSFKFQHFLAYALVFGPFFIVNSLRYGLRFEGREVLRKYRKELKGGAVSVSNHCYRWDGMAIAEALRRHIWIPMLHDHFQGPDRWYLRYFGGIPLSDGSLSATRAFNNAFDEHHRRGEWVHVFPEARNWHFYKPVRPFQKGAFTMAYRWGVPVVPISISYRKRKGICRLFDKAEIPLITVRIGEPIFPDTGAPRKAEVDRLLRATHAAVCELGGITSNTWDAE